MSTGEGTGTLTSTESFIPASAIAICNMALGHLGARPITSIDEESQEARYCKIFWDNNRDELLRSYPWNFADAKVLGGSVTVPTVDDDLWDYAYTYPTNAVQIRRITEDGSDAAMDFKVILEQQTTGELRRLIMTNAETAAIHYTMSVENPSLWDATFITAVSYLLASKIAVPITKNAKVADFMLRSAFAAIPQAKRDDFKENKSQEDLVSPWETARFS